MPIIPISNNSSNTSLAMNIKGIMAIQLDCEYQLVEKFVATNFFTSINITTLPSSFTAVI